MTIRPAGFPPISISKKTLLVTVNNQKPLLFTLK
jgi:hypothetical protein